MNNIITIICRLAGFEPFDVQKHGRIAPAAWHGIPAPAKEKPRKVDDYKLVAVNEHGDTAYSTPLKVAGDRAFESPVRSGTAADAAGKNPALTHADLIELRKKNISQTAGEKIKVLWAQGLTAGVIASKLRVSQSLAEKAIGAFNSALKQTLANASAKH
jgi:hypothetical protein